MNWMEEVYCNEVKTVADKIVGKHKHLSADLMSHVFCYMTTLPDSKITDIQTKGNIKGYFIRTMYFEFNNPRTTFYKQFRKQYRSAPMTDNHDYAKDRKIEEVLDAIDKLPSHEYMTLMSVINYRSINEMSKATTINYKWIAATLKSVREKIK